MLKAMGASNDGVLRTSSIKGASSAASVRRWSRSRRAGVQGALRLRFPWTPRCISSRACRSKSASSTLL